MDKGAHFYKCDFQVHTPRDINWSGVHHVTEDDRKTFSKRFIKQCREKGLNAVAITDHHDFAFFKFIREAAAEELDEDGNEITKIQRITIFPGLEMTFADPASCQAILILDADFPDDQLNLILAKLSIDPNPDTEATTVETKPISSDSIRGLVDLHTKLDSYAPLKGRYIVLPNVGRGHGSVIRRGFYEHYVKMPCVGGYVDGAMPTHEGHLNIINGRDGNYGYKSIGVIQTSDNRCEEGSKLGVHATWIKWAEPTAEALRQACLARESRITIIEPQVPQIFIKSIDVTASKFLSAVNINFNQQYNALIGGRGTGKSTILEYLRWGLCDQPIQNKDQEEMSYFEKRRDSLISKTLAQVGGEVRITFELNGVPHIVKRKPGQREIQLKIDGAEFRSVFEEDVRKLLPVRAYSQKQLSEAGVKPDELSRLIEQPITAELEAIRQELSDVAKSMRESYSAIIAKKNIESDIANLAIELESFRRQVLNLRDSLVGTNPAEQEIIGKKAAYDAEVIITTNLARELDSFEERADSLISILESYPEQLDETAKLENIDLISSLSAQVDAKFESIKQVAAQFKSIFNDDSLQRYNDLLAELQTKRSEFDVQYQNAISTASVSQQQLAEISRREKRLAEVELLINLKKSVLKEIGSPDELFNSHKQNWFRSHRKKLQLLVQEAETFSTLSRGLIKAEVSRNIDLSRIKELLKSMFEGTRIREDRIDALLSHIKNSQDPLAAYQEVLEEFREMGEFKSSSDSNIALPVTEIFTSCNYSAEHIAKLCGKISSEDWMRLATTEVGFVPRFSYCTNNQMDDTIPFGDASAGQQATALLAVLLNQEGPPLIIDQPEDDIDNKAIKDIIDDIWNAKKKRQLIFASHNANLVVNGDAELVVCFGYHDSSDQTRGKVKCEGAIDTKGVRDEITSVMEGGEKVFRLRKEKYGY